MADKIIGSIFATGLTFVVALIGLLLVSSIASCFLEDEPYVAKTTTIMSVKDNLQNKGESLLGTGQVEGGLKYYFMVNGEFGMDVKSLDSDRTSVKESSEGEPEWQVIEYRFKEEWANYWFANLEDRRNVLVVPVGSVKFSYSVDLE